MNRNTRKRPLLEMSACVVLVATLAVQPALGRDGDKGKGHAGASPAVQARSAAPASRDDRRTSNSGRRSPRQAAAPNPAATAPVDPAPVPPPPAPTPPPVDPGPPPIVPPTTAGPEDGAGAPTPTPTPAPTETPAPTPAPAEQTPARTPVAANDAVAGGTQQPSTSAPVTPTAADVASRELISAGAPQTIQPDPAPAAVQALDPPTAASTTATANSSATANRAPGSTDPASDAGLAQARGTTARGLPTPRTNETTGGTAPSSPLSRPLNNPASDQPLGLGISKADDVTTSKPQAAGEDVPKLGPSTLTRTVRDVVNVVPRGIWIAIAGLALLVLLLGAHTILAAARTKRLQRQREKLMEDIGLLQAALLPAVPSRMGALLTTVAYRPADGPAAGGDFYDAFPLPDGKVALLLGDVSGHGRQALAKTTLVRFTVRAHLEAGMSPREAIAISGRSLDGRLADDFSTVLAAIHDPATGTLTYSSAGHPPPLVLGPSAHAPVTASSAPPIGVGFPTGQRQTIVPMPEGTTVAVYSDGLLEARMAGEPLGAERLTAWLTELGPGATAKQLLDLVVQRADRVPDDLAAVVIHAAPGATAPAARVEQLKLDVLDVEGPDLDGFLKAAGVSRGDRAIAGRRVSEQLAITSGVIVEVRTGEHPTVSVYAIGDRSAGAARQSTPAR